MHIIFLYCWHTVVITASPSPVPHLPPSLLNHICLLLYLLPPVQAPRNNSWQNKCCNHSASAHISVTQLFFIFPSSFSAGDKCLSHLLSGCTTAAWDFGYLWLFFSYCCTYFTLLWIRVSAKCINCICIRQQFSKSGLFYCFFLADWSFTSINSGGRKMLYRPNSSTKNFNFGTIIWFECMVPLPVT